LSCTKLTPDGKSNLASAIDRIAERITQGTLDSLPPYRPPPFPVPAADRVTFFDWMVLTCYPDELAAQMHLSDLEAVDADFISQQRQQQVVGGTVAAASSQESNGMLQLD
jgi:beta-1,4-N-acetylglucosaminyltransferase